MGFFDSKKTTKNTNIVNDYTTTDNSVRQVGDGAIVAEGIDGPVTITSTDTDHGAVAAGLNIAEGAFEFSGGALELVGRANADSLDFAESGLSQMIAAIQNDAEDSRKRTSDQIDRAFALAQTHSRSEGAEAMQTTLKALTIGGGLLASAVVVSALIKAK